MKKLLKIGLVLFVGSIILTSCNDKKGSSAGLFEDKISVSMDKDILAVMKGNEISFYKLSKENKKIQELSSLKMDFSENIDEISFSTLSSLYHKNPYFFIRQGTELRMYRLEDDKMVFEKDIKDLPNEVDDMNFILNKAYFRNDKTIHIFEIGDTFSFEKEVLLNEVPNELVKGDDEFLYRMDTILKAVKDQKYRWEEIPVNENVNQVFFSYEKKIVGIRTGEYIKLYDTQGGKINELLDFKIE